MKCLEFKGLLQNNGWCCPAFVGIDSSGKITGISKQASQETNITKINGYAIPGFQNAHSHAFQYAMAGLGEIHPPHRRTDDFWSWRNKMYQIALTIDPDQLEAIAAMLYAEMLLHGYTHVAEFHYLHHDKNGKPYQNQGEMGERLVSAAQSAGIKITLIPIFYQKGGFDTKPNEYQRRFISPSVDHYWKLLECAEKAVARYPGASLGFGIHSLRAVHGEELRHAVNDGPGNLPFHMHIAEQPQEVAACSSTFGMRPVEYLFDQVEVTSRFHLVHATHLSDHELNIMAASGAHVVLCPTTEGNLGDGLFRFRDFRQLGGIWSIGTDSHVGLSPLEELRLLDYTQRLISHQRHIMADKSGDSGLCGLTEALIGGRKAMGNFEGDFFKAGQPFDAVIFNAETPLLAGSSPANLSSTIVYTCDKGSIMGTMVNGEWVSDSSKDLRRDFYTALQMIGTRS